MMKQMTFEQENMLKDKWPYEQLGPACEQSSQTDISYLAREAEGQTDREIRM